MFDSSVKGLDPEFAKALIKWKRMIFKKILSIKKVAKLPEEDIFQDFMVEMIDRYNRFMVDQYTFEGHTYTFSGKTLGDYVWIETPDWNKRYMYGRWILKEELVPITKSCLSSYIYRHIVQFQTDYFNRNLTSKNGYVTKSCGKSKARIYSSNGEDGSFIKEIDRTYRQPMYGSVSLSSPICDEGATYGDCIEDTGEDILSKVDRNLILEIMQENMSSEGFDHICRTEILGERLTLTKTGVILFNREVDLVQRVLKGEDPLRVPVRGVAPVRFGLTNVKR
jgi:hypothetical protein